MKLIKISLILCICLSAFGLEAQVPAPKSVVITMEAPQDIATSFDANPIDENGEIQLPETDHEVVVVVELEIDQALQSLFLEIKDMDNQQSLVDEQFDLIAATTPNGAFSLQRNGKIISINLGILALPSSYSCEVKVAQIDGQISPAKVYNSSL
ncbi:MAG: hypothetical protein AAFP19_01185 [Bacteroidota bacterium]